MDSFGQTIRKLRENEGLPLRIVAAFLDIDQAILSKIERGQRKASREQVVKLANFFKVNENKLIVSWLSDRVLHEVADEVLALKALQVAEETRRSLALRRVPQSGGLEGLRVAVERLLVPAYAVAVTLEHAIEDDAA